MDMEELSMMTRMLNIMKDIFKIIKNMAKVFKFMMLENFKWGYGKMMCLSNLTILDDILL